MLTIAGGIIIAVIALYLIPIIILGIIAILSSEIFWKIIGVIVGFSVFFYLIS